MPHHYDTDNVLTPPPPSPPSKHNLCTPPASVEDTKTRHSTQHLSDCFWKWAVTSIPTLPPHRADTSKKCLNLWLTTIVRRTNSDKSQRGKCRILDFRDHLSLREAKIVTCHVSQRCRRRTWRFAEVVEKKFASFSFWWKFIKEKEKRECGKVAGNRNSLRVW